MGILDSYGDPPKSKTLRYAVSGVAFALMLAGSLWWTLRFTPEKHTVERFLDAVVAGNTQQAYQIWHSTGHFTYDEFLSYWGPSGYYSPVKSYRIRRVSGPSDSSGVIVNIEISPDAPFPSSDDAVKSARTRELQVWVERSDKSMSFPPPS